MFTTLRVSMLGLAAGLLALLTFVAAVYLALALSTVTFTFVDLLAKARAAEMALEEQLWPLLGQSLIASGRNALSGLWNLWGAFVVFGMLGVLAAWSHQAGLVLYPARAWWISFLWVAVLVVIATVTWVYIQGEEIALWMAASPETYRWRDLVADSQVAAITVSPIFALAFTYPAWVAWRWWYTHLHRPVELASSSEPLDTRIPSHGSTSLVRIVHGNGLLMLLALLAAGCFAGYLISAHYHAQVAVRLQHGVAFVDATAQPRKEFVVQVASDVRQLRIVNLNGVGNVTLALSPAARPTQIAGAVPDWAFEWRTDDYLYQDMPVQKLAPGSYILRFEQHAGWGYFEYMLSQGGGYPSQALAMATGLLLATSLSLASAFGVLAVIKINNRHQTIRKE